MRTLAFVLALALAVTLAATPLVAADSETPSISRDARGPQPTSQHDPLGAPATPRLYLLGQTTIFAVGVALLVVAAILGAYTLARARPTT